jgi:hypothetical protein
LHGQTPHLLRMSIMRDHSKAWIHVRNNLRHRMPAGADRVGRD